jgi:hypothetical protein
VEKVSMLRNIYRREKTEVPLVHLFSPVRSGKFYFLLFCGAKSWPTYNLALQIEPEAAL